MVPFTGTRKEMEVLEGKFLEGEYTPFEVPQTPQAAESRSSSLNGTK